MTVNPVSKLDNYPIQKVEELFTRLQGGKSFTKLNLRQAYQQLELEEESKKYVVVNTPTKAIFATLGYHSGWLQHPECSWKTS